MLGKQFFDKNKMETFFTSQICSDNVNRGEIYYKPIIDCTYFIKSNYSDIGRIVDIGHGLLNIIKCNKVNYINNIVKLDKLDYNIPKMLINIVFDIDVYKNTGDEQFITLAVFEYYKLLDMYNVEIGKILKLYDDLF